MNFNLNYTPKPGEIKLSHQDKFLMIGSCFSEHIGEKLANLKFDISSNPFGIVFNPESIIIALNRIIKKRYFDEADVFEKDGLWYSLECHSSIYATRKPEFLDKLNAIIDEWNVKLKSTEFLIITLGSAFAYRSKTSNRIVSNCHKLPSNIFEKELLEQEELLLGYKQVIDDLKNVNPSLKILFTISPVKHLRDGVMENSLSKAILIQTVHKIVHQFDNCFYFPAYELVTDDLRDYRFYEADMAHPNKLAIEYVWEKFSDCYFSESTKDVVLKLEEISQAINHRPFNHESESHSLFKKNYLSKCNDLSSKYNWLDMTSEINYFSK